MVMNMVLLIGNKKEVLLQTWAKKKLQDHQSLMKKLLMREKWENFMEIQIINNILESQKENRKDKNQEIEKLDMLINCSQMYWLMLTMNLEMKDMKSLILKIVQVWQQLVETGVLKLILLNHPTKEE